MLFLFLRHVEQQNLKYDSFHLGHGVVAQDAKTLMHLALSQIGATLAYHLI